MSPCGQGSASGLHCLPPSLPELNPHKQGPFSCASSLLLRVTDTRDCAQLCMGAALVMGRDTVILSFDGVGNRVPDPFAGARGGLGARVSVLLAGSQEEGAKGARDIFEGAGAQLAGPIALQCPPPLSFPCRCTGGAHCLAKVLEWVRR